MSKKKQKEEQKKELQRQRDQWSLRIFLVIVLMGVALMAWLVADKPSQAEVAVIAYAREHGISSSAYPEKVIKMLENNPEMEEFVLNYPFREDLQTDLTGYDLSQGVPLLMQWDKRWGYMEYGGSMVAVTGAGPLCLAMAGYYVTGDERFYPENVVRFAIENEYYSGTNGSKQSLISKGGAALGLEVTEVPMVQDKVIAYLKAGNPIIAAVGPGAFSASNHFIVLTGCQDGMVTVHDPNSYVNSGREWGFEELAVQITNLWVIKAAAI